MTFLLIPLFVGGIPLFGTLALFKNLKESDSYRGLAFYVLLGPPLVVLFWLSMSLLGVRYRKRFL
jgi:hypothetical protein